MNEFFNNVKIATGILGRRVITGPISVQIGIVDACNYRCIMCWEHSSELDGWGAVDEARNYHVNKTHKSTVMDFDLFKSLVKSLRSAGTRRLNLSGIGEPLLHKKVVEAVAFTNEQGMNMRLVTNGSLLTEDLLQELVAAGMDDLNVSINAGAKDEYGKVHADQENDVFDRIVNNLMWLKEYKKRNALEKPFLHLSNVVSNINSHRALDMMQTGLKVGARSVDYRPIDIFPRVEKYALRSADLDRLNKDFVLARRIARENGIETCIDSFNDLLAVRSQDFIPAPCFAGWLFPFILANGDVTYCCLSREIMGNLNEEPFESIWYSRKYREFNKMALQIHRTQRPVPQSRCIGCERTLQNLIIYRRLWPLWGKPRSKSDSLH